MKNKQFIVTMSILMLALAVSIPFFLFVPKEKDEVLVSKLPMKIGEWQGRDLDVDKRAYEILETKNLILREYVKGEDKVYIYAIYSSDNRKVSHPPEVCFEGSGVTIIKKDKIPLELAGGRKIVANELIVEKAGINNIVVYWYKAGEYYVDNYLMQQLRVAFSRLQFKKVTGAAMIRFSAEVAPIESARALESIKAFAKESSAHFDEIMP